MWQSINQTPEKLKKQYKQWTARTKQTSGRWQGVRLSQARDKQGLHCLQGGEKQNSSQNQRGHRCASTLYHVSLLSGYWSGYWPSQKPKYQHRDRLVGATTAVPDCLDCEKKERWKLNLNIESAWEQILPANCTALGGQEGQTGGTWQVVPDRWYLWCLGGIIHRL